MTTALTHGPSMPIQEADTCAQLARDLITAWNAHDARKVASYFADGYVGDDVSVAGQFHGPRDVRKYVLYNLLGFPDLHFELHETISQGDKVAIVWTVTGTHQGKVMNIPATGARVEVKGISVITVKDGKIVRSLRVWDVAGMLRHIGLLPDLPTI